VTAVAFIWLAASVLWLVVIAAADFPSWPLAAWVAATTGPLAVLANRSRRSSTGADSAYG
jgi:hypothetical protein